LAGGIATIGAIWGTGIATGGIGLMVAGAATGILGPLLFPEDPPMTKEDVTQIAEDIARAGDEKVLRLVNGQMNVVKGCFDRLAGHLRNVESHQDAMSVYEYFMQKITDQKANLHLCMNARTAKQADTRFRNFHDKCATVHGASSQVVSNNRWNIRGLHYSAAMVHDWASICYTGYVAWGAVHAAFQGHSENEDPLEILRSGKNALLMFENYYSTAARRIYRGGDLGLFAMFQMYTSAFTSNIDFAYNLAQQNRPFPPMPAHGRRQICYCRHHPPRGYRLLQTNATTEESEDAESASELQTNATTEESEDAEDASELRTNATTEEFEDAGDSSEAKRPWERQRCSWTTSGKELCPRRLPCAPRGLVGYETCTIPYYSKKDYCRVCKGTTCTDTVKFRHYHVPSQRRVMQDQCFRQGGIYIPNW